MKNRELTDVPKPQTGFDLFRLSKSKELVDLAPNTLRRYNDAGLNFYRQGKAVFVSRAALDLFIRGQVRA